MNKALENNFETASFLDGQTENKSVIYLAASQPVSGNVSEIDAISGY